jgi:peptide chain release factor 1
VFQHLDGLEKEYDYVLASLSDPEVIADNRRLREASKRHRQLEPVVLAYRELGHVSGDLEVARPPLRNRR